MRKLLLTFCLFFGLLNLTPLFAVNIIVKPSSQYSQLNSVIKLPVAIPTMKVKQLENLLGRKLKFKEKIALKLYKWKENVQATPIEENKSKKGKTSMILGIISLGVLVIPYAAIAALPLAILAIVFGNQAKKENPADSQAKTGVILGWVTLGLIIVATIVALAFISAFAI